MTSRGGIWMTSRKSRSWFWRTANPKTSLLSNLPTRGSHAGSFRRGQGRSQGGCDGNAIRGATALFDAIAGFSESVSAQPGKKAIIAFADGSGNHGRLGAEAASAQARQSGVPI